MYTEEQIEIWRKKAEKWDKLYSQIEECYEDYDDEGNDLPSKFEIEHGRPADLGDIGEIAASALGFI